ncbi:low molecular weight protein-tyrosine-phosphatase [candidate division CSSED10-310 bacterium]|uniref:Low molecular weight protein-tyrosine-phosphatase n=1 Tax=candidate division CSSED10-310 bacterium TaxID=2855610 RepID=A0ABV6Z0N7_UNCC1
MKIVLFVCTGNICRSPMAEYYLKHLIENRKIDFLSTFSAGTHGCIGIPAAENASLIMQEQGIDMSAHEGNQINEYMVSQADWILVMEHYHKLLIGPTNPRVMLLTEFAQKDPGTDIPDPYGKEVADYRQACSRICECVQGFVDTITDS